MTWTVKLFEDAGQDHVAAIWEGQAASEVKEILKQLGRSDSHGPVLLILEDGR